MPGVVWSNGNTKALGSWILSNSSGAVYHVAVRTVIVTRKGCCTYTLCLSKEISAKQDTWAFALGAVPHRRSMRRIVFTSFPYFFLNPYNIVSPASQIVCAGITR